MDTDPRDAWLSVLFNADEGWGLVVNLLFFHCDAIRGDCAGKSIFTPNLAPDYFLRWCAWLLVQGCCASGHLKKFIAKLFPKEFSGRRLGLGERCNLQLSVGVVRLLLWHLIDLLCAILFPFHFKCELLICVLMERLVRYGGSREARATESTRHSRRSRLVAR